MTSSPLDLERLILEPAETLEVEYKEWLDLRNKPHKAKLAKELIALRNHGGGHLVLGFSDPEMKRIARPEGYEYVTTDYVNGIVAAYCEPPFHCDLVMVNDHPVISVPAGVTIPVRSKKDEKDELKQNQYFIRRPGPNSEVPRSGLEWDSLLRRCIENRDSELEAMIRRIVRVMSSPGEELPTKASDRIDELLK